MAAIYSTDVETFLDDLWEHERDTIHPSRKATLQEMLRRKGARILWSIPGSRRTVSSGQRATAGLHAVMLAIAAFGLRHGWFVAASVSFSLAGWMIWRPLALILAGVAFLMIENKEMRR